MKKIVVAEDHADMREVLAWEVESLGFSPIAVKNGKEAVEKAVEEKPLLILMDIMMPEMDGREATRVIRSNPETRDIPIVAATVLFRESDLQSCIDAGCNDYLVKPFTLRQLRDKIKEFVPIPKEIARSLK